jgi:hypothetical protein
MSWTDKKILETMWKLKDEFKIPLLIETGTWKGVNASVHAGKFDMVFTCEIDEKIASQSREKLKMFNNVVAVNTDSPTFLTYFRVIENDMKVMPMFYLDAHFYDSKLKNKFVVLDELDRLRGFKDCIIVIHDFDCEGLGHITYDGQSLDWNLVKEKLMKVNPNFKIYTNTKDTCDIVDIHTLKDVVPKEFFDEALDNLKYVWSKPEKTYRGVLYAVPKELDLKKYDLKRQLWN